MPGPDRYDIESPRQLESENARLRQRVRYLETLVRPQTPDLSNAVRLPCTPTRSGTPAGATDDTNQGKTQLDILRSRQRLRALAKRLHDVREEERTTISRQIHDELGQALTGLKIDLFWLNERLPRTPGRLRERATSMLTLLDRTIDDVRSLAWRLRPAVLDLGLDAAVEWLVQDFESRTRCVCRLSIPRTVPALDPEVSTAVFRILQEALTNVARHAEASHVEVRLVVTPSQLELRVADDGKGVDTTEVERTSSLGVIGMRERAGAFGGRVTFGVSPAGGTRVDLNIPITER